MTKEHSAKKRLLLVTIAVAVILTIPVAVFATDVFSDVPDSDWAHDDISWLAEKGLTNGCGPGLFCPDANVTRKEIAAFTHRGQVLLGTRYAEAFNATGTLGHDTNTLLVTTSISAPNDGGALSIAGLLAILEGTSSQLGLVWTEVNNGGLCNGSGQSTFAASWTTELLGQDTGVTVGGGPVAAGGHRVDLCGWALGDRSNIAAEVEVLWIATGSNGGDFGESGAENRSNVNEAKARLASR